MSSAAQLEAWEYYYPGPDTQVTYTPPAESTSTRNGTTISIISFTKADPISAPVVPQVHARLESPIQTAQSLISEAISRMQYGLRNGIRPSLEVDLKPLAEADDEDIFWIKASISDHQG